MKVKDLVAKLALIDPELEIIQEGEEYGYCELTDVFLKEENFYRNEDQEDISWRSNITKFELDEYIGKYCFIELI